MCARPKIKSVLFAISGLRLWLDRSCVRYPAIKGLRLAPKS